jgi:hypothetical protein
MMSRCLAPCWGCGGAGQLADQGAVTCRLCLHRRLSGAKHILSM